MQCVRACVRACVCVCVCVCVCSVYLGAHQIASASCGFGARICMKQVYS